MCWGVVKHSFILKFVLGEAPEPQKALPRSPAQGVPPGYGRGANSARVTAGSLRSEADLHHRSVDDHRQRGHGHVERYSP